MTHSCPTRRSSDLPVCLTRNIPALSLLCLVENAIKHGIAPNREPGWLRISARPLMTGWVLAVSNSIGHASTLPSHGTGLAHLRGRLQSEFAEREQVQRLRAYERRGGEEGVSTQPSQGWPYT